MTAALEPPQHGEIERVDPVLGAIAGRIGLERCHQGFGGVEQPGRLEVGGDLHDLVVGPAEARSLIGGA